jgi:ribose 5-phosphate isomerase A
MKKTNFDLVVEKKAAAEKAVGFVESGMIVGLGTGSTVKFFIESLAEKVRAGLTIKTVSTSNATQAMAESLGFEVVELNGVEKIDVTIDGADEVDSQLNGIKGGGGALLYEKIVASSSKKNIWIVDSSKYVEQLGKFPLPVEVVPFGVNHTFKKLFSLGYKPEFRSADGKNYVTDGNHYIIDLYLNKIENPAEFNNKLLLIPGVVETGLFLEICDVLIMGIDDGVRVIPKLEKD